MKVSADLISTSCAELSYVSVFSQLENNIFKGKAPAVYQQHFKVVKVTNSIQSVPNYSTYLSDIISYISGLIYLSQYLFDHWQRQSWIPKTQLPASQV